MRATSSTVVAPTAPATLRPVSWKVPGAGVVSTALLIVLAVTVPGEATIFQVSRPTDLFVIPDVAVPALLGLLVLTVAAAAATVVSVRYALARRRSPAWLGIVMGVSFVLGFLVWAGAGRTTVMPLTTMLAGGLALSVPLIFGAMSGVVCEHVGVVNIAIEGQLLAGAFLGAMIASVTGVASLGLIAAPIAGLLVGVLLALFAVEYHVDQIIIGVVLNVLVIGLTNFFFSTVMTQNAEVLNARQRLPDLPIPLLGQIPIIGPVLFRQTLLVYLMFVIVVVLQIWLFRSRWGLRLRSVGEHPRAADTVGIDVRRTRWLNTLLGSALAGLGGAYFTIGSGLAFGKEMSAGNGYIALAAMILGGWNPKGAVAAALLFGFSRNVANTLSTIGSPVPSDFLLMIPYAVTILAVAGFVGRVRPPAAENQPYVK